MEVGDGQSNGDNAEAWSTRDAKLTPVTQLAGVFGLAAELWASASVSRSLFNVDAQASWSFFPASPAEGGARGPLSQAKSVFKWKSRMEMENHVLDEFGFVCNTLYGSEGAMPCSG